MYMSYLNGNDEKIYCNKSYNFYEWIITVLSTITAILYTNKCLHRGIAARGACPVKTTPSAWKCREYTKLVRLKACDWTETSKLKFTAQKLLRTEEDIKKISLVFFSSIITRGISLFDYITRLIVATAVRSITSYIIYQNIYVSSKIKKGPVYNIFVRNKRPCDSNMYDKMTIRN